jgi:hypothetical protein
MRDKIPRISSDEVISAFSTGVTDIKMREKLFVNDELTSVVRLFEIADRCAKAKEGRLFVYNLPEALPPKLKSKDPKCKEAAALAADVDGFCVARTRGTTRWTQRFERRGLNVGDLGSQRNTMTKASSRRTHNTLQRGTPSFTQVQGPRCEVKPLFPAFLYYDMTPREKYKAMITEL